MSALPSHRNAHRTRQPANGVTKPRRRATRSLPILVDAETLAQTLGVGVRHVRRLVEERRIPFIKVGRYVRFDVEQVAEWIDGNRVAQCRPAVQGRHAR